MTPRKMRALVMLMVLPIMLGVANTSARPAWDYFLFGTEDLMHVGYDLATIAVCAFFGPAGGPACAVVWIL